MSRSTLFETAEADLYAWQGEALRELDRLRREHAPGTVEPLPVVPFTVGETYLSADVSQVYGPDGAPRDPIAVVHTYASALNTSVEITKHEPGTVVYSASAIYGRTRITVRAAVHAADMPELFREPFSATQTAEPQPPQPDGPPQPSEAVTGPLSPAESDPGQDDPRFVVEDRGGERPYVIRDRAAGELTGERGWKYRARAQTAADQMNAAPAGPAEAEAQPRYTVRDTGRGRTRFHVIDQTSGRAVAKYAGKGVAVRTANSRNRDGF